MSYMKRKFKTLGDLVEYTNAPVIQIATTPVIKRTQALRSFRGFGDVSTAASDASTAISDALSSDAVKTGSGIACIYHGYRRTSSLVWALIYGLAGREWPDVVVPIALAQGFGKRKVCTVEK